MNLIDKDALVAEIEKRKDEEVDYDESSKNFASYADQIYYSALDSIENFINTLEVKGVDIDEEFESNPAWSEEDEKILHEISQCVYDNVVNIGTVNKVHYIDWLKSLKDRIHPQSEWSEEDKGNLLDVKCVIDEVWHNQDVREEIDHSCEELESLWHWLDNIWQRVEYPQSHWKPSEYDISLLEEIARNIRNNVRPFCSEVSSLEDLIENLKTL